MSSSLNFPLLSKCGMKLFDLVKVKFFNQNHCSFQHWLFKISSQDIYFYVTCHKTGDVKSKMTQTHSDEG